MTRLRSVYLLVIVWIAVFGLSFFLLYSLEPTGDGFTRGLNRLSVFLTLQGFAVVVAIVMWLLGRGIDPAQMQSRWLHRIPVIVHATMAVLIIGVIAFLRYAGGPTVVDAPQQPVATTVPDIAPSIKAAESPVSTTAPDLPTANLSRFNGIFRGGFEASHFYTMEGQGPWWLEASEADWDRINAFYVHGPGRAGGVRVAMSVDGWLEETDGELDYLGIDGHRIHVVSIDSIRPLSEEEFEMVLNSINARQ